MKIKKKIEEFDPEVRKYLDHLENWIERAGKEIKKEKGEK